MLTCSQPNSDSMSANREPILTKALIQFQDGLQDNGVSDSMSANREPILTKALIQFQDGLQDNGVRQELLCPEAQCIASVLRNCISKSEIAAMLPAVLQLNSMSSMVDEELNRALKEHQMFTERLERLEGLKQESDREQQGRESSTAQLEEGIKNSFRNLLRFFRDQPDIISAWKEGLEVKVEPIEKALIREIKKFHSHILEKSLSVQEPQLSSSSHHDEERSVSPEDFDADIEEVDAKISQKNHKIQSLKSSLQEKKKEATVLAKQLQSIVETSQAKQSTVQQETDQLNTQLNNLILANKDTERALHERSERVEAALELLLQEFDNEIEELQAKLELNEMEYEGELEELNETEMHISDLEAEYNHVLETRRLAEEKRKEELRELELKTKAAILAQAWWRGYSTRKALKNKGKSKKAKKGKGKK